MKEKTRFKFIGKVIGFTLLGTGFLVSWGIIIANAYKVSDAPVIILSAVNAVAVVALAWFTYSYMKSTEAMAIEMKVTREMDFEIKYRPWVTVDFMIKSNGMIYLLVTNEGNGAARNISFRFEPELRSKRGGLENFPALQNGLTYLPPKKSLYFFFDSSFDFLNSKLDMDFTTTIEYDWSVEGKPKIVETLPLQLSPFLKTDLSSYKDESTLIDEIEKIRKELEKIAKNRNP